MNAMRLEGANDLVRQLERVDDDAKKIARAAIDKGVKMIASAAASKVPVRTGALAVAYGSIVKTKASSIFGMAGARRGVKGLDGVAPTRYDHLVENGTAPHQIPIPIRRGGKTVGTRIVKHPGTKAQPHLGPAFETFGPWAMQELRNDLSTAIRRAGGS